MKYYEIIETLNQIDEKAISSVINSSCSNLNNDYYNAFINDSRINEEIVCFLSGEYYLENYFSNEKNKTIIKFIEKNYQDGNKLYSMFKNNFIFGQTLISNYVNHKFDPNRTNKMISLSFLDKGKIITTLNPYCLAIDNHAFVTDYFNFITKNYVFNLMLNVKKDNEIISYFRENVNDLDFFLRTLFGNAYKVMYFKNYDNEIFDFTESSNYECVKNRFLTEDDFYFEMCNLAFQYYQLPMDTNEKINSIIIKNSRFKNKLKEINPFIDVEIMSDLIWNDRTKKKIK